MVTREGIWLGSNWLRVARDTDVHGGVLARKAELENLALELEQSAGHRCSTRTGITERSYCIG